MDWRKNGKEVYSNRNFYSQRSNEDVSNICYCCSVTKSCPTLYDCVDCSIPGFPVIHYLPEFVLTHVHWVGDAIQPSHPLPPPSPLALNLSQHLGLFQWVGSSKQVAKVLELQHPMNSQGWFPSILTGLISLQSQGLTRVFSSITIRKHPFFSAQPFLWSNSHPYTTTRKIIALTIRTFVSKVMSLLFKTLLIPAPGTGRSPCRLP